MAEESERPPGKAQDERAPRASSKPRASGRAGARRRRKARGPYKPSAKDRDLVRSLSGYGIPAKDIALIFQPGRKRPPLTEAQIERLFADELENGPASMVSEVARRLYNATDGKDAAAITAQKFFLQSRGGWKTPIRFELDSETGVVL